MDDLELEQLFTTEPNLHVTEFMFGGRGVYKEDGGWHVECFADDDVTTELLATIRRYIIREFVDCSDFTMHRKVIKLS